MALSTYFFTVVFLLCAASLKGVESQCPPRCSVNLLSVWPGSGYRASLEVDSPVFVKAFRLVRINLKFNKKISRIESVHVKGGIVRRLALKGNGKSVTFLYGPDQVVRKGKSVLIDFVIRDAGEAPKLTGVLFWRKVACANTPCSNVTTIRPATTETARATLFPTCSRVQRIIQTGPDFFKVMISVPVIDVLNGWVLELQFTKPVLAISNFDANLVEERNKMYFRLKNFRHNEVTGPGIFAMTIMVHFKRAEQQRPKIAMIKLDSFQCKINDAVTVVPTRQSTTSQATTKIIVTSKKTTSGPTTEKSTTGPASATPTSGPGSDKSTTGPASTKPTSGPASMKSTFGPASTTPTSGPTLAKSTSGPTSRRPTSRPTTSPTCAPKYDYGKVLNLSLLFYEAQRSGKLPKSNRIQYRKDSALNDGNDVGKDLSGGYYDAGDFVKFGFPMAYTITVISWGVIQYKDAYQASGQYSYVLEAIKWGTDYFMKCHTAPNEFYGQVGDGNVDHSYWGRPEEMTMNRPSMKIDSTKPGSELAGETAAALAAAYLVFKDSNAIYAGKLLQHARELYDFANMYRGSYSNSIPNAAKFYRSYSGYNDELTWAAAWLFRATNVQRYLQDARTFYSMFGMNSVPNEFSWDDKKAGVQALMAQITNEDTFKKHTESFCDAVLSKARTPKGLVYISQWGSNRHASNVAFICLLAADLGIKTTQYRSFARSQIHYMLGDSGRSYVVGFGKNPPQRPHHRSSSCPNAPAPCSWNEFNSPSPNLHILYGALVGGPDKADNYVDDRKDYIKNEIACDYNAGFQSAVAALRHLQNEGEC